MYFSAHPDGGLLRSPPPGISDRERQILKRPAGGAAGREIAAKLNITGNAVHSYLDRLRKKERISPKGQIRPGLHCTTVRLVTD
ncbi:LuxR C-terminal-related transcriptional regulator [Streptomyces sp. NPDC057460]|uniref:LuxR C-terminal-related transcriptional regulator n=1 Tax=Streptomyces sp. NPDC057460 TaxID=3346141 RepID=UPI0036C91920